MNRAAFYAVLRQRNSGVFGTALSTPQVRGIDAILDEAARRATPLRHLAYILATAYHETGHKMQPVRENLNYSVAGLLKTFGRHRISAADADRYGRKGKRPADQRAIANILYGGDWGRRELGNTEPDDGWRYRAGGLAGITGRRNFTTFGIAADPDRSGDLIPAVRLIFDGMEHGLFTGASLGDFTSYDLMRQVINSMDRAGDIAGYAEGFAWALQAAGYGSSLSPPAKPSSPPAARKPADGAVMATGIIALFATLSAAIAAKWAEIIAWLSTFGG